MTSLISPFLTQLRKPRLIISGVIIVILIIVGSAGYYWWSSKNQQVLNILTVNRTTLSSTVDTTGKVQPAYITRLSFPFDGRVKNVMVKPGDVVTTGTKLITITNDSVQRNVDDAKVRRDQAGMKVLMIEQAPSVAEVDAAQSQLDAAKARQAQLKIGPSKDDIALAQAHFDLVQARYHEVLNKKDSTKDQQDEAKAEVDAAQAQLNLAKRQPTSADLLDAQSLVDAAQAQLDAAKHNHDLAVDPNVIRSLPDMVAQAQQAQQAYDTALSQLASTVLTATISGTIISVDTNPGEHIGGGQVVLTLADLTLLQVNADVDEIDISRTSIGQLVNISLDAFPGITLEGTIKRIYPSASDKQGSTVYTTIVAFNTPPKVALRPGMAASVLIITLRKTNVLTVPLRAVETGGPHKFLTLADDPSGQTHHKVEVTTGFANQQDIEIVSGLHEGDRVIVP